MTVFFSGIAIRMRGNAKSTDYQGTSVKLWRKIMATDVQIVMLDLCVHLWRFFIDIYRLYFSLLQLHIL